MDPDDFKQTWKAQSSQSRLTIDSELLLKDVLRNQHCFATAIFWRDVREVGTSLLMVPLWFYMGAILSLPWTWYLTVPVLVWVAGYMLAYRMRHHRQPPEPGEPLRQHHSAPRHPSRKRALRHAELPSRFLAGLPLQVAQHDGDTILVGQAAQLLVEQRLQVAPEVWFGHGWFGHRRHLPLSHAPFCDGCPRLQRGLVGHAVEPVGKQLR